MGRHVFLVVVLTLVLVATVAVVTYAIAERERGTQARQEDSGPGNPQPRDELPPVSESATTPQPRPAVEEGRLHIERVELNGQDLAELLGVPAWRFDYQLPEDDEGYRVRLWLERWTRDVEEPQVGELIEQTLLSGSGSVLLRLPTEAEPTLFARVGTGQAEVVETEPIHPPQPFRRDELGERSVEVGETIHLLTFTHNMEDSPVGGLEDVHREHDVTVYIKARFERGE